MNYPISDKVLFRADSYAEKSHNYTHEWSGFKGGSIDKKKIRISTGKIAELWTAEYCLNKSINHVLDKTHYTENDDSDILINGWDIDCKSSMNLKYSCQVQPSHDTGNSNYSQFEYYAFFFVDRNNKMIMPLGFMEKCWLIESSEKVHAGEKIRGGVIQKHNYSYFIRDSKSLIPFESHVEFFGKNKARNIK